MKRILFAFACLSFSMNLAHAGKNEGFELIKSNQVSQWLEGKQNVAIFDANNDSTRVSDGMVPGAVPLASSSSYDTKALPADKGTKLVFYCANEACMASHAAAKRAVKAGYKAVFVMSDGIQGWKKAGKTTQPFKS